MKKKANRARVRRGQMKAKFHTFKGTAFYGSVVRTNAQGSSPQILGEYRTFSADQISNWTQLSALFDAYRIKSVACKFVPLSTGMQNTAIYDGVANTVSLATVDVGQIASAIDYNGSSGSAFTGAFATVMQYDNCKIQKANEVCYRKFRPVPQVNMLSLVAGATSEAPKGMWINTDYGSVPHCGIYFAARPSGRQAEPAITTTGGSAAPANLSFVEYDLYVTYEIEFKNIK